MPDIFQQACFDFHCSAAECSLLQEAFLLCIDLGVSSEPECRSTDFMTLFPSDGDDRWAGFRELFEDRDYPDFGADLAGGATEIGGRWHAVISADTSFDPLAVARLLQRCCRETLGQGPIGFEWSLSCSRQRVGEFGGGWCAVFADRIDLATTGEALAAALNAGRG